MYPLSKILYDIAIGTAGTILTTTTINLFLNRSTNIQLLKHAIGNLELNEPEYEKTNFQFFIDGLVKLYAAKILDPELQDNLRYYIDQTRQTNINKAFNQDDNSKAITLLSDLKKELVSYYQFKKIFGLFR